MLNASGPIRSSATQHRAAAITQSAAGFITLVTRANHDTVTFLPQTTLDEAKHVADQAIAWTAGDPMAKHLVDWLSGSFTMPDMTADDVADFDRWIADLPITDEPDEPWPDSDAWQANRRHPDQKTRLAGKGYAIPSPSRSDGGGFVIRRLPAAAFLRLERRRRFRGVGDGIAQRHPPWERTMTKTRDQKFKKFALAHFALLEAVQLLNTVPRDADGLAVRIADAERIDMLLDTAERTIAAITAPALAAQ